MLTGLTIYKIIFVIEILAAMHLFSFKLKKKKNHVLRYIITIVISLFAGFVYPVFDVISYTWWYVSIMFLLLFLVCMFGLFFVYDVPWQRIFIVSVVAYTIQHFSHQTYNLICYSFNIVENSYEGVYGSYDFEFSVFLPQLIIFLNAHVISYISIFLILGKKINDNESRVKNSSILIISALILFVDIILNSVILYIENTERIYLIVISVYNILCCLMILYIQNSMMINRRLENELYVTSNLLHESEQKYNESKMNVELINIKCHDLKHQIRLFGKKENISRETIKELEEMINIYDANVKTGNEVLDVIITEKSLICKNKNIKFNCLADCSRLSFLSNADAYSLFGNAIDNAIEAVLKLNVDEKRCINLIVRNTKKFVSITIYNYFAGNIDIDGEGMPKTTKKDKNFHGFGVKSMKMIVDKYHGDFNISISKDVFKISILFNL